MRPLHPYSSLKPYQVWRKSVSSLPTFDVDPVVSTPFKIGRQDKVASVGSCFAQHISNGLRSARLNYYVTETKPADMSPTEAERRSFGVFSARYGNVYTARQLVQLMDRAFGDFSPSDHAWRRADGRWVDPFRPMVEPDGYETEEEVEASRIAHFAEVRRLFETLDILIFTLGLTEAWQSKHDGAVFPVAPGVVAGEWDPAAFEFVNFTADEVAKDMDRILSRLASVNSRAKLILTVSPVPLIATYEDRHILVSTTYSKSALRVAADALCRANKNAYYFHSYEIIASHFSRGEYFADNLRAVTPAGVGRVMDLFLQHFYAGKPIYAPSHPMELASGYDIVCDEEQSLMDGEFEDLSTVS
jgi:hypothetical protein